MYLNNLATSLILLQKVKHGIWFLKEALNVLQLDTDTPQSFMTMAFGFLEAWQTSKKSLIYGDSILSLENGGPLDPSQVQDVFIVTVQSNSCLLWCYLVEKEMGKHSMKYGDFTLVRN